MTTIALSLQALRTSIAHIVAKKSLAKLGNHSPAMSDVTLIAVSKMQTADKIRAAFLSQQTHFGENYLQEALSKQTELTDCAITWHFIGPIQSNKTSAIAEHFDWVHTVDRLKVAERLNSTCSTLNKQLNICIQINVSAEDSKSGVSLNDLPMLAQQIQKLTHLKLRGLMAIPAPTNDMTLQHAQFKQIRLAAESLNQSGFALDTLSMGMSDDYEAAILEGATMIRLGTAIFGARPQNTHTLNE